jgi:hypothetical protein
MNLADADFPWPEPRHHPARQLSGPNAEAWRQALIDRACAARMETGSADGAGLRIDLLR